MLNKNSYVYNFSLWKKYKKCIFTKINNVSRETLNIVYKKRDLY